MGLCPKPYKGLCPLILQGALLLDLIFASRLFEAALRKRCLRSVGGTGFGEGRRFTKVNRRPKSAANHRVQGFGSFFIPAGRRLPIGRRRSVIIQKSTRTPATSRAACGCINIQSCHLRYFKASLNSNVFSSSALNRPIKKPFTSAQRIVPSLTPSNTPKPKNAKDITTAKAQLVQS